jgi:hypothetical protein
MLGDLSPVFRSVDPQHPIWKEVFRVRARLAFAIQSGDRGKHFVPVALRSMAAYRGFPG